jgi:hypothetical protein
MGPGRTGHSPGPQAEVIACLMATHPRHWFTQCAGDNPPARADCIPGTIGRTRRTGSDASELVHRVVLSARLAILRAWPRRQAAASGQAPSRCRST